MSMSTLACTLLFPSSATSSKPSAAIKPPSSHIRSNSSASRSRSDAVRMNMFSAATAAARAVPSAASEPASSTRDITAAAAPPPAFATIGTAGAFLCRSDVGSCNKANAAGSAAGGTFSGAGTGSVPASKGGGGNSSSDESSFKDVATELRLP